MAVEALTDAADEDTATGGVDPIRGIYPLMKLCDREGITDIADDEVGAIYESIVSARRDRGVR